MALVEKGTNTHFLQSGFKTDTSGGNDTSTHVSKPLSGSDSGLESDVIDAGLASDALDAGLTRRMLELFGVAVCAGTTDLKRNRGQQQL